MTYTIKRVATADIPAFIQLRGRMFTEVGFEELDDLAEVSERYFAEAIPDGSFIGFIAQTDAGEAVGSAGLSLYTMPPKPIQPDGRFGYISSMYVAEPHRGNGLAGRLLTALVDAANDQNLTWVTLHASEMGRPIYEKARFKTWKEMGLHVPTAIARRAGRAST